MKRESLVPDLDRAHIQATIEIDELEEEEEDAKVRLHPRTPRRTLIQRGHVLGLHGAKEETAIVAIPLVLILRKEERTEG